MQVYPEVKQGNNDVRRLAMTMRHKLIRIRVAGSYANVSESILKIALGMAERTLGSELSSFSIIHIDGDERGTAYIEKAKRTRKQDKALGFDRQMLE